jgi:uncharacterized protein (TIGR01777 family)
MRILLTGATGLLGRELGRELIRLGHDLTAVSRAPDRAGATLPCRWIGWSDSSGGLAEVDTLIHLAGAGIADRRWSTRRKQVLRDSRLQTAKDALALVHRAGASLKTVVTASAVGIYGDRGETMITEETPAGDDFAARLCVDWEAATKGFEGRWIALRTAPVLTKQGGVLGRMIPPFRSFGASRIGSGRQFMPWIHIHDWVRLVIWCLDRSSLSGPVNLSAPGVPRNAEFTLELKKALRTFSGLAIPAPVLRLALGEMASMLLASQRVVPEKALASGFEFEFADLHTALADLLKGPR